MAHEMLPGRTRTRPAAGWVYISSLLLVLMGCAAFAATITYSYDSNGHLTGLTYDDGTIVTYSYDSNGNRTGTKVTAGPPGAPTNISATAQSISQINVSWTASSAAAGSTISGYYVERCQGAGCTSFSQIGTTSDPSYVDPGLSPSTTYVYRIRSYSSAGLTSAYSATASATTNADTTPPTAPASLTATAASGSQINLTWTGSTDNVGVVGYKIERCQGSGCTSFTQITTTSGASYSDTSLSQGSTYTYRVRAYDAAGNNSGYSNTAAVTLADTTPPSAPAGLTASLSGGSTVNLSWSASTDNVAVAGYAIERCQGSGCTSFTQITTTGSTSYSDGGVSNGFAYGYRVRAYDAAGNYSGYSNTATVTLADTSPPTAPSGLTASASSWSTVNLSWSASTDNVGVAGYKIYRGGTQIGTSAGTSYTDSTTAPNSSYSYTVSAYDAAGNNSGQSGAVGVTTPSAPAPSAPSGLTAAVLGDTQITLTWNAASDTGGPGIAGYKIYRGGTQIGTTTATSFTDTGVSAFNTYTYTVAAYDSFGTTSGQSSSTSVSTFYQITDGNGNVVSAAASLYTVSAGRAGGPNVYYWQVVQAYGSKAAVIVVTTGVNGSPPACAGGTTQQISTGYQRSGCVSYAAPSVYGH
jgi:YD repeat-containing protein